MQNEERFLREAIELARANISRGGRPFGALVVRDGAVIATGVNEILATNDPTAHAEVLVLRDAARHIGNYRLTDADVYVTVEPCLMCVGALIHARVREVIYGATEPKTGVLVSTLRALEVPNLNHRFAVSGGVREEAARDLIQEFFREKRRL